MESKIKKNLRSKKDRLKRKNLILKYKEGKSCCMCGYNKHTEILQFHHPTNDKIKNISTLQGKNATINLNEEEIKKYE